MHVGASAQWVAWKLWWYTMRQQPPASAMKPGETSLGSSMGLTVQTVEHARDPIPMAGGG